MKNKLLSLMCAFGLLAISVPASALVFSTGGGCNIPGQVSYVQVSDQGYSIVVVDGLACILSGTTPGETASLSSTASQALVSNKIFQIFASAPSPLTVTIQ